MSRNNDWHKQIMTEETKEAVYKAVLFHFGLKKEDVLNLPAKKHADVKMMICGLFRDGTYKLEDIPKLYGRNSKYTRYQIDKFYLAMNDEKFKAKFERFKETYTNNLKLF